MNSSIDSTNVLVANLKQSGSLFFVVVLRGKDRYHRDLSTHYRSFKLATSKLVLSILNVGVMRIEL